MSDISIPGGRIRCLASTIPQHYLRKPCKMLLVANPALSLVQDLAVSLPYAASLMREWLVNRAIMRQHGLD